MVLLRSSSVRLRLLLLLLLLLEKRLSEMSDDLRKRTQKSAKIEKTKKFVFFFTLLLLSDSWLRHKKTLV